MTDKQHKIKFDLNTRTGGWYAQCSDCPDWWGMAGSKEEIIKIAEDHQQGISAWVEADPYAEKVS